jgi:hypothetical protein
MKKNSSLNICKSQCNTQHTIENAGGGLLLLLFTASVATLFDCRSKLGYKTIKSYCEYIEDDKHKWVDGLMLGTMVTTIVTLAILYKHRYERQQTEGSVANSGLSIFKDENNKEEQLLGSSQKQQNRRV